MRLFCHSIVQFCTNALRKQSRLAKLGMRLTGVRYHLNGSAEGLAMASAPSCVSWQSSPSIRRCRSLAAHCNQSSNVTRLLSARLSLKRARQGTGTDSRRQLSVMMAKPGPGGGVLDRPAVLPGYDNKQV